MKSKLRIFVLSLAALLPALPSAGQVPDQLKHSIPVPRTGVHAHAQLGYSVATDGGYTVVGVPGDDIGTYDSGSVEVFDSTTGALLLVLQGPAQAYASFGRSLAISGTRVVAAISYPGTPAQVYVYDLSSATPTIPVATVPNPAPGFVDFTDVVVAISGTRMVIGTPKTSSGASRAGSAYVYDLNSATPAVPVATLPNPAPAADDCFGNSVAISGTRVVIGAYGDDTGAINGGSVYVYDLSSGTPTVPVFTMNNAGAVTDEWFGKSVAISGSRIVVGVYGDDHGASGAGRAEVFDLSGLSPTLPVSAIYNPSPGNGDTFGNSVAISGTRIVVGAPNDDEGATNAGSAYVYDLTSATPTVPVTTLNNPGPAASDQFGWSVAISGSRVVAGAYSDDTLASNAGSAYLYDTGSGTPTVPVATLNSLGAPTFDSVRAALAMSGNRVLVSVFDGQQYVARLYDLSSATPLVPVMSLPFSGPLAMSGTRVVMGEPGYSINRFAYNLGRAYLYDLASATPATPVAIFANPSPNSEDRFGSRVAISGSRIVVTTSTTFAANRVYVYDYTGATPGTPVATLLAPSAPPGSVVEGFGMSVAISGTRIVVGADWKMFTVGGITGQGAAYVYDFSGPSGGPNPIATFYNPHTLSSPNYTDSFATTVAISGNRVLVGAPKHDAGAVDAGRVYVYDTPNSAPVAILDNPAPGIDDAFGTSLSISDTRIVVGAPADDTGALDAGSVYVYDLASSTPLVPVAAFSKSNPVVGDSFGGWVAIDGTTIAVLGSSVSADDTRETYIYGASPYSLWKVTEAGDQFASDLGDLDGDGLSNLGEYGLLRSPIIPNGAAATTAPTLYSEGTRLRMFVPRDPARNDVTLEVQATGDLLGTWTTIATSTLGAPFTGPGYFDGDAATPGVKSVEVRDTVNLQAAAQRWMRVKVRH